MASGGEPFEEKKKPSYTWAECMRRTYELSPLECPKCGGSMRIIAFLTNQHEIEKIMRSQGIAKAQAPPPIPLPKLPALDNLDVAVADLEYV